MKSTCPRTYEVFPTLSCKDRPWPLADGLILGLEMDLSGIWGHPRDR